MDTILERTAQELGMLNSRRQAVEGIRVQMRMLETDVVGFAGVDFARPNVNGKQKKKPIRLGTIEERERLQRKEQALQGWITHVEQAMKQMHPEDVEVLRVLYLENRRKGEAVRILSDDLHVSSAEVYRMRERALADLAARLGYIV